MKRFLSIILVLSWLLALSSCGAAKDADEAVYAEGSTKAFGAVDDRLIEASAAEKLDAAGMNANGKVEASVGLLTAGEWKDLDNLSFWKELLRHNDWYALMESRALYPDRIAVVEVKDEKEHPCFNANIDLLDESGAVLCTAVTDVAGQAYLAYDLDRKGHVPKHVRVADTVVPFDEDVTYVTLANSEQGVRALDLMLTVDTTGSMGDELDYLKVELEDVIKRVSAASGDILSINVSINFYRDTGDIYVVQPFEFTGNISDAIHNLQQQLADGGGDYPEAVHTALESSVYEHQWREDAVKLLFLVLDAPPHSESEIAGIDQKLQETVTDAAELGIRIIPVASSGVNTETEFLVRSFAVMTGGTYIFLTDHSGIGGEHLEPTIGEYQVEALNDCLVRVIKEYCNLQ